MLACDGFGLFYESELMRSVFSGSEWFVMLQLHALDSYDLVSLQRQKFFPTFPTRADQQGELQLAQLTVSPFSCQVLFISASFQFELHAVLVRCWWTQIHDKIL